MLTNNTYFENLKRIGHEYEAARVVRGRPRRASGPQAADH